MSHDLGVQRKPVRRPRWLVWNIIASLAWVWFKLCYRYRTYDSHHARHAGPLLIVSNHESYLDPVMVGIGRHGRPLYSLARATLWKYRLLGRAMEAVNTIAVGQEATDMKAMRFCLDVLKAGYDMMLFPEGARSPDGVIRDFEPGMMVLVKRARPQVVPAAVVGGYDIWPRGRKRPRLFGRLVVQYGPPIPADELLALSSKDALTLLKERVKTLRLELQARLDG
jgi:1-acyl-sn-glycerol-3-phosphate acyltransferase